MEEAIGPFQTPSSFPIPTAKAATVMATDNSEHQIPLPQHHLSTFPATTGYNVTWNSVVEPEVVKVKGELEGVKTEVMYPNSATYVERKLTYPPRYSDMFLDYLALKASLEPAYDEDAVINKLVEDFKRGREERLALQKIQAEKDLQAKGEEPEPVKDATVKLESHHSSYVKNPITLAVDVPEQAVLIPEVMADVCLKESVIKINVTASTDEGLKEQEVNISSTETETPSEDATAMVAPKQELTTEKSNESSMVLSSVSSKIELCHSELSTTTGSPEIDTSVSEDASEVVQTTAIPGDSKSHGEIRDCSEQQDPFLSTTATDVLLIVSESPVESHDPDVSEPVPETLADENQSHDHAPIECDAEVTENGAEVFETLLMKQETSEAFEPHVEQPASSTPTATTEVSESKVENEFHAPDVSEPVPETLADENQSHDHAPIECDAEVTENGAEVFETLLMKQETSEAFEPHVEQPASSTPTATTEVSESMIESELHAPDVSEPVPETAAEENQSHDHALLKSEIDASESAKTSEVNQKPEGLQSVIEDDDDDVQPVSFWNFNYLLLDL